jgi:hypothetical protein
VKAHQHRTTSQAYCITLKAKPLKTKQHVIASTNEYAHNTSPLKLQKKFFFFFFFFLGATALGGLWPPLRVS